MNPLIQKKIKIKIKSVKINRYKNILNFFVIMNFYIKKLQTSKWKDKINNFNLEIIKH